MGIPLWYLSPYSNPMDIQKSSLSPKRYTCFGPNKKIEYPLNTGTVDILFLGSAILQKKKKLYYY